MKEEILEYLHSKEGKIKSIVSLESKFQEFLTRNICCIGEWSFGEFLSNVDKEIEYCSSKSEKMIEKLRKNLMTSLTDSNYTNGKLSRATQLPYIQSGMKYSIGNLREVNRRERGRMMYGKN
jgi:hypothetical protein